MSHANTFGTVALAAYHPNVELFGQQLRSIQRQSHSNFECLISSDGNAEHMRALVREIIGDDERFRVIGFEDRRGFYGNFERVIAASSERSDWVALSDQDDLWYERKLETLLPYLNTAAMVSGQARVVEYPSGRVISKTTGRRNVKTRDFMLANQFTGSLCVLRRSVIELAIPFPRLATPTEVHDQWLALCASFVGGTLVVDELVGDYVQHESNVMGEVSSDPGVNPRATANNLRNLARRYEGSDSPAAIARLTYAMLVGWRELIAEEIADRTGERTAELDQILRLYGRKRSARLMLSFLRHSVRTGLIPRRTQMEYTASLLAGFFVRSRTGN